MVLTRRGIKELRDILKELAHKEGTCVVVSSHLMSEMEMMCDRVGIIANGKMIGSYTMEELISQSDSSIAEYVLEVDDPQKAMGLIKLADEGQAYRQGNRCSCPFYPCGDREEKR